MKKTMKKASKAGATAITRAPKVKLISLAAIREQISHYVAAGDVVGLRDLEAKAQGVETYVRAQTGERADGLILQNAAAEAVIRIERALGTIFRQTLEPGNPNLQKSRSAPFKLADIGVTKKQSSRWQKLAAIPEDVLEDHIASVKAKCEKLTTCGTIAATSDAAGYDSNEWFTPADRVEAARTVLGEIDLDPASNAIAQQTVRATRFYTKDDDARSKKWEGRVFFNPPYEHPLVEELVRKLLAEHAAGHVTASITLVNNATDTAWMQELLGRASAVCLAAGRIAFLRADGQAVKGNRQGQVFVYIGDGLETFTRVFAELGVVMTRASA